MRMLLLVLLPRRTGSAVVGPRLMEDISWVFPAAFDVAEFLLFWVPIKDVEKERRRRRGDCLVRFKADDFWSFGSSSANPNNSAKPTAKFLWWLLVLVPRVL